MPRRDPFRLRLELSVEDTGAWRLSVNGLHALMVIERRPGERAVIAAKLVARAAVAIANWVEQLDSLERAWAEGEEADVERTVPVPAVLRIARRLEAQADSDDEADVPPGTFPDRLRRVAGDLREMCA